MAWTRSAAKFCFFFHSYPLLSSSFTTALFFLSFFVTDVTHYLDSAAPTFKSEALPFTYSVCYYAFLMHMNQLTNSITHTSITVFIILGENLSFTQVANGLKLRLEVHFSISDSCPRLLSHQNQANILIFQPKNIMSIWFFKKSKGFTNLKSTLIYAQF